MPPHSWAEKQQKAVTEDRMNPRKEDSIRRQFGAGLGVASALVLAVYPPLRSQIGRVSLMAGTSLAVYRTGTM